MWLKSLNELLGPTHNGGAGWADTKVAAGWLRVGLDGPHYSHRCIGAVNSAPRRCWSRTVAQVGEYAARGYGRGVSDGGSQGGVAPPCVSFCEHPMQNLVSYIICKLCLRVSLGVGEVRVSLRRHLRAGSRKKRGRGYHARRGLRAYLIKTARNTRTVSITALRG